MKIEFIRFLYALQFLTIIPVQTTNVDENLWKKIAKYFSLVGVVIGLLLYLVICFLYVLNLPNLLLSALVVLSWILITGGLHLDGLMDSFDGIACQNEEKKYEAMKDSRIGAFGAIAGILLILLKFSAIYTILEYGISYLLILICALSRTVVVYALSFCKNNESSSVSADLVRSGLKVPFDFYFNSLVVLMILFIQSLQSNIFIIVSFLLLSIFVSSLWIKWINKKLKGLSGDVYGAIIEFSEVSSLIIAVLFRNYL